MRTLIHAGAIRNLCLLETDGKRLKISDFDRETSHTVLIDGTVAILRRELTDSERQRLCRCKTSAECLNFYMESEATANRYDSLDLDAVKIIRVL